MRKVSEGSPFRSVLNKGFQITFENGLTVSVQWGRQNYCDKRDYTIPQMLMHDDGHGCWDSPNAEVAVWDSENNWVTHLFFPGIEDDVVGRLTPAQVLALMVEVERYGR